MKTALLMLFCFLYSSPFEKTENPYLTLQFDKVIMYAFSGGIGSDQSVVDLKGHLAKSIFAQAVLDKESTLSLNKKLGEKNSFINEEAACFEPGLGFVYYLKGEIVAYLTVCLGCNIVVSSIPVDPKEKHKFWANNSYFVGSPSKSFHAFFDSLLKKHNLYHR